MQRIIILLLVSASMLLLSNCSKIKERKMTDREKLTSKTWTSYKYTSGEDDVTDMFVTSVMDFFDDGTCYGYLISNNLGGKWYLSGATLSFDSAPEMEIKEISTEDLKVGLFDDNLIIYFH